MLGQHLRQASGIRDDRDLVTAVRASCEQHHIRSHLPQSVGAFGIQDSREGRDDSGTGGRCSSAACLERQLRLEADHDDAQPAGGAGAHEHFGRRPAAQRLRDGSFGSGRQIFVSRGGNDARDDLARLSDRRDLGERAADVHEHNHVVAHPAIPHRSRRRAHRP